MPFALFYLLFIGRLALSLAVKCPAEHQATMTGCLATKLSKYAMNLRFVTSDLSKLECAAHNSISQCWRNVTSSDCSLADAKRSSEALTDVLLHRDMNATFLYGVLALDPICDAVKGKTLVAKHHACLKKYHEGKGMLQAVDKIHAHLENPTGLCQILTTAGATAMSTVTDHCKSSELGEVMCKAVVTPFLILHSDLTVGCTAETLCPRPAEPVAPTSVAGAAASQNGDKAVKGAPSLGQRLAWWELLSLMVAANLLLVATRR